MRNRYRVLFILPIMASLIMIACQKDNPAEHKNFYDGYITFINTTSQAIILVDMTQTRGGETFSRALNLTVIPYGGRTNIENLMDGGDIFPGGDYVAIRFRSTDYLPHEPDTPRFERTVILTVNGPQNIRVKGYEGQYDIGGD